MAPFGARRASTKAASHRFASALERIGWDRAANARWDAWLLAAFRKLCPVVPTPDLDEGLEEYTEEEVDAIVFADEVNRPDQW